MVDAGRNFRYFYTYIINAINEIGMAEWIGRELEQLRKLRGLRREDVAAQLSLSPSTIRNIEHDDRYNVSLDLLRQIAAVLGATITVSIHPSDAADPESSPEDNRTIVTNDAFIRRIRERYPDCPLTNSQIGRRMWQFAQSRGASLVTGRKAVKRGSEPMAASYRSPTTAAEYAIRASDVAAMERFADRLGRAFKDGKGRVLVPIK
jgi:transcriptional regulator with XRE-family HTH domain